jgi:hypothetical protein
MKLRLSIVLMTVGFALLIGNVMAIPFLHEDIATGGRDPDGDHYLTGGVPGVADPMPGVYCAEGHADIGRDGVTNIADLLAVLSSLGSMPPPGPFYDQNHNDQSDFLDIVHVTEEVGGTVGIDCAAAVADMPMPTGLGSTFGGDLVMDVVYMSPQPPNAGPPWGDIIVTVRTAGPDPDPYSGFWVTLRYNELAVQAVPGSFENLSPFGGTCPALIDNVDDSPGVDDGSYRAGCGSFTGATWPLNGQLARFTFERIDDEFVLPNFCLGSFNGLDDGRALNGTYTFAPDMGPQDQENTASFFDADFDDVGDCYDNCPLVWNFFGENNDGIGGPFGGLENWWIPDGLAVPEGDTLGGDACDINDDNDLSCTDAEETTAVLATGGMRNPLNPWDFADVPTPALPLAGASGVRNGAVTLGDVGAALFWVGAVYQGPPTPNGVDYDNDDNGNSILDGIEYDRIPNGQISGPPSGAVSLQDVGVILAQVGDSCLAAPN